MVVYLDCASTTPIDSRVLAEIQHQFSATGNSGSRTHAFGQEARRVVEASRDRVARATGVGRGEVLFTSGATESNNLAILGLAEHGRATGRRHIISTHIEHNSVLTPLQVLESQGFEVTRLGVSTGGWVCPQALGKTLRPDTLLVSVMHVNNETGVVQPVDAIAEMLQGHEAYFHVDSAQGFAREDGVKHARIDLISISGHKIHGPQGVGALIARRRSRQRPPLAPLLHGGGQELGLRPGTLPVALVAGFGLACELAAAERDARRSACAAFGAELERVLGRLGAQVHGERARLAGHIINVSFPGLSSEGVIEAVGEVVAISDGSACTSASTTCSHVLRAMGVENAGGAVRLSWSHMTPRVDWERFVQRLLPLVRRAG